jgi:hypothetical protein
MSVFFSATGDEFDVNAFLISSTLEPDNVFYRGQKSNPDSKASKTTGFSIYISDESAKLDILAEAAFLFLQNHEVEFTRLVCCPGLTDITLDFHYDHRPEAAIQCDYLPAKLLALAGSLKIDIELSLCNKEFRDIEDEYTEA